MNEMKKILKESQDVLFREEMDQLMKEMEEEKYEWRPSLKFRMKMKWMFIKARFFG